MPLRFKTTYTPVETDFHGVKCHWTDKMLMSLYEPLNNNSRYQPVETKVMIINITNNMKCNTNTNH